MPDSPKLVTPIIFPFRPTYLSQKSLMPASIGERAVTDDGNSDFFYRLDLVVKSIDFLIVPKW